MLNSEEDAATLSAILNRPGQLLCETVSFDFDRSEIASLQFELEDWFGDGVDLTRGILRGLWQRRQEYADWWRSGEWFTTVKGSYGVEYLTTVTPVFDVVRREWLFDLDPSEDDNFRERVRTGWLFCFPGRILRRNDNRFQ